MDFLTSVSGVGLGIIFGSMGLRVQAASSDKYHTFAVSTFSFSRTLDQAVGVAVGGGVFLSPMNGTCCTADTLRYMSVSYLRMRLR